MATSHAACVVEPVVITLKSRAEAERQLAIMLPGWNRASSLPFTKQFVEYAAMYFDSKALASRQGDELLRLRTAYSSADERLRELESTNAELAGVRERLEQVHKESGVNADQTRILRGAHSDLQKALAAEKAARNKLETQLAAEKAARVNDATVLAAAQNAVAAEKSRCDHLEVRLAVAKEAADANEAARGLAAAQSLAKEKTKHTASRTAAYEAGLAAEQAAHNGTREEHKEYRRRVFMAMARLRPAKLSDVVQPPSPKRARLHHDDDKMHNDLKQENENLMSWVLEYYDKLPTMQQELLAQAIVT